MKNSLTLTAPHPFRKKKNPESVQLRYNLQDLTCSALLQAIILAASI